MTTEPTLTKETLKADIQAALLSRIREVKTEWHLMSEDTQRAHLHELNRLAEHIIESACDLVASDGVKTLMCRLGDVTNKGRELVGKVTVSVEAEDAEALFKGAHGPARLTFVDEKEFMGGEPIKPDPDQAALFKSDDDDGDTVVDLPLEKAGAKGKRDG